MMASNIQTTENHIPSVWTPNEPVVDAPVDSSNSGAEELTTLETLAWQLLDGDIKPKLSKPYLQAVKNHERCLQASFSFIGTCPMYSTSRQLRNSIDCMDN
jgi:hypothetical protein